MAEWYPVYVTNFQPEYWPSTALTMIINMALTEKNILNHHSAYIYYYYCNHFSRIVILSRMSSDCLLPFHHPPIWPLPQISPSPKITGDHSGIIEAFVTSAWDSVYPNLRWFGDLRDYERLCVIGGVASRDSILHLHLLYSSNFWSA